MSRGAKDNHRLVIVFWITPGAETTLKIRLTCYATRVRKRSLKDHVASPGGNRAGLFAWRLRHGHGTRLPLAWRTSQAHAPDDRRTRHDDDDSIIFPGRGDRDVPVPISWSTCIFLFRLCCFPCYGACYFDRFSRFRALFRRFLHFLAPFYRGLQVECSWTVGAPRFSKHGGCPNFDTLWIRLAEVVPALLGADPVPCPAAYRRGFLFELGSRIPVPRFRRW
jgi:hypothetical protein